MNGIRTKMDPCIPIRSCPKVAGKYGGWESAGMSGRLPYIQGRQGKAVPIAMAKRKGSAK